MRLRPTLLFLTTAAFTAACSPIAAQSPSDMTLSLLVDGTRIRANGPGVRDLVRPSVGDLFRRGLLSLVIRPSAEGVVVDAAPGSLRFTESRRNELLEVPWVGIDYVDVYEGRSAGVGMLQGAGLGAFTGLAMWGLIELLFLAADNPVVDDPEYLWGIGAGAGALVGAVGLGHRWGRVYPPRS